MGELTSETRADVGSTTNAYDHRGRLTNHAAGSSYSLSLGYDFSSNVTSAADSINGNWTYVPSVAFRGQLASASCAPNCPNGWGGLQWTYDQFGNRWKQNVTSGSGPQPSYTFDTQSGGAFQNRIVGSGVGYDAAGNMTADGLGNTYAYDAEDRLISMNSGSYKATYDALGNRVEQNNAGTVIDYIFGLNGRILHDNTSTIKGLGEDVFAGNEHIGLYANGTLYMVHHDQVNSIRKWTVYSGSTWSSDQTVTNLPFGDALTPVGTAVSDHDYFGDFIQDPDGEFKSPTRRYSATQGRWQIPDPAGLAAVDPSNPQTWNRYAYVNNNPLSNVDPTGLRDCLSGGGVVPCSYGPYPDDPPAQDDDPTYDFSWLPLSSRGPYYTVAEWDDIHGRACGVVPLRPCPANNGTPQKTPCAVPSGNHLSMGASVQVATVNPFTSGGGGVWGANQQSFGATTYNYTYSGTGAGLDVGASIQSAWAWGSGSWGGPFKSISFSAGPFSGSIFWTPGKGGWTGASFGLGVGSPGAAYEVTNYTCKSGPG